jgi:hypothetical protein
MKGTTVAVLPELAGEGGPARSPLLRHHARRAARPPSRGRYSAASRPHRPAAAARRHRTSRATRRAAIAPRAVAAGSPGRRRSRSTRTPWSTRTPSPLGSGRALAAWIQVWCLARAVTVARAGGCGRRQRGSGGRAREMLRGERGGRFGGGGGVGP